MGGSSMKKLVSLLALTVLLSTPLFAADQGSSGNEAGKNAGASISGFFQKLNPLPFFQQEERKYNERKAGAKK